MVLLAAGLIFGVSRARELALNMKLAYTMSCCIPPLNFVLQ